MSMFLEPDYADYAMEDSASRLTAIIYYCLFIYCCYVFLNVAACDPVPFGPTRASLGENHFNFEMLSLNSVCSFISSRVNFSLSFMCGT